MPPTETHLKNLEQRLLQTEVRLSPAELDELLADEFIEFTSTGAAYDKAQIIELLVKAAPAQLSLEDFKATLLAPDIALATFVYHRGASKDKPAARSLRSSIWKRFGDRWRLVFHQGTLCPEK